jgi:hypothetical protein
VIGHAGTQLETEFFVRFETIINVSIVDRNEFGCWISITNTSTQFQSETDRTRAGVIYTIGCIRRRSILPFL